MLLWWWYVGSSYILSNCPDICHCAWNNSFCDSLSYCLLAIFLQQVCMILDITTSANCIMLVYILHVKHTYQDLKCNIAFRSFIYSLNISHWKKDGRFSMGNTFVTDLYARYKTYYRNERYSIHTKQSISWIVRLCQVNIGQWHCAPSVYMYVYDIDAVTFCSLVLYVICMQCKVL